MILIFLSSKMERYAVVETVEDGIQCVTRTPKRWIINDILYWPNTTNIDRSNPKDPVKGEWLEFSFVMLKDDLSKFSSYTSQGIYFTVILFFYWKGFEEAIAKEKLYSEYRNTESEREDKKRKALKRKHPVNMRSTGSEIDVNDMINSNDKKAKMVDSNAVQKTNNLPRKKQKQRKSNSQGPNANKQLKSKSGTGTSSKSNATVPARKGPPSTFIPNRSRTESSSISNEPLPTFIPNRIEPEETIFSTEVPIVHIGNSELPAHENNYQLYLTDFLDTSFETGPTASAATQQSNYLTPNPVISYDTQPSTLEHNCKFLIPLHTIFLRFLYYYSFSAQSLLKQIHDRILKLMEIVLEEKKHRQESEARIQVNFDLISNNLLNKLSPSSKISVIDRKKISSDFKLPITEREQVGAFNKYLADSPEYKESLVTISYFLNFICLVYDGKRFEKEIIVSADLTHLKMFFLNSRRLYCLDWVDEIISLSYEMLCAT